MKQRKHRHSFFRVFLSLCFPVKVSHLTVFFFLDYKKVDYDTHCFSETPHVLHMYKKKKKKKKAMCNFQQ